MRQKVFLVRPLRIVLALALSVALTACAEPESPGGGSGNLSDNMGEPALPAGLSPEQEIYYALVGAERQARNDAFDLYPNVLNPELFEELADDVVAQRLNALAIRHAITLEELDRIRTTGEAEGWPTPDETTGTGP